MKKLALIILVILLFVLLVLVAQYFWLFRGVVFTGTIQSFDSGCWSDGICSVIVDDKYVETVVGWASGPRGEVSLDLPSSIGQQVEVKAKLNSPGNYTLYGSDDYYIKPILD